MIFRICEKGEEIFYQRNVVRLQVEDRVDNGFQVSFDATYYDHLGRRYALGLVRIGMKGMKPGAVKAYLPTEFSKLTERFFSLGQDELYYEHINQLSNEMRGILLESMRDLAFRPDVLERVMEESVLRDALIRDLATDKKVAIAKTKGQLCRMAHGSARLTEFSFSYTVPQAADDPSKPTELTFFVKPESNPPSNIHALIGQNGCGKTYLIKNMLQCLKNGSEKNGRFTHLNSGRSDGFVNALCVAFSPFEDFSKLEQKGGDIPITFVGLTKQSKDLQENIWTSFWKHFNNCLLTNQKRQLWRDAIHTLTSDSIFEQAGIDTFMDGIESSPRTGEAAEKKDSIQLVFNGLSSGHKVVLLIVTSCVAEVEERSILFLDEPENHLHPPLLSALIRVLSELLKDRNGVAIISTHSPVVLQEIPRSCVWLLNRYGTSYMKAERLERETFGTSLGLLMDDVFGLEIRNSGFHKLMEHAARQCDSFEEVMDLYEGQLGNEAGFLLRMLMRRKLRKE